MIMAGNKEAVLMQLQLVNIHGTLYYDLVYAHTDDEQPRSARIGKEDIYADPQPGDRVRVAYTMNVVTGIQRAEESA
jgi:hypothetical protein